MWHSLWLGWLTIGEKLPSRPPRVYLNHKKPTLFKVWDHNLIALYLLFMSCDQFSFHVVNVEPLVGKFLSFQTELIFFVPISKLHVAIKRLDIDGTLVGRNIEDGLRLSWCRSNSASSIWHLNKNIIRNKKIAVILKSIYSHCQVSPLKMLRIWGCPPSSTEGKDWGHQPSSESCPQCTHTFIARGSSNGTQIQLDTGHLVPIPSQHPTR